MKLHILISLSAAVAALSEPHYLDSCSGRAAYKDSARISSRSAEEKQSSMLKGKDADTLKKREGNQATVDNSSKNSERQNSQKRGAEKTKGPGSKKTAVQLNVLDKTMIEFLQNYLRINTAHPQPDYEAARAFLKKQALKDGFAYEEVSLPSGNKVVIITFKGSDSTLPAMALNHHMDVVPAPNVEEWTTKPFDANITKGVLIARGVQDMKGVGVTHYFAMKALKDAGIKPTRTIHLIAVPDEERGGFKGTKELVETKQFKKLNIGFITDEGRTDAKKMLLKIDEKKPLQIRITCKGDLAHGSRLSCTNAIHELTDFLNHIIVEHKKQQKKAADVEPGLLLSMNVTSVQAGYVSKEGNASLNVVPDTATATIDIRVPPTMKLADVKALVEKHIKRYKNASYRIEATVDERQQRDNHRTKLYQALEKAIKKHGLDVVPHVSEGASDLRFYLKLGIDGIGLTPFLVEDNIHGTDESVSISEIVRGRHIFTTFLKEFCC